MKSSNRLWAGLIVMMLSSVPGKCQCIERKDFYHPKDETWGWLHYEKTFDIGAGVRLGAVVNVDNKGNGILEVGNLKLHIFDEHDDGAVYEGGLLRTDFAYLSDGKYKNLLICGILVHTHEKTGAPLSREPVMYIYDFDPKAQMFSLRYKVGPDLTR